LKKKEGQIEELKKLLNESEALKDDLDRYNV